MLPIAGFDKSWIVKSIKRDLAKKVDDHAVLDSLIDEYRDVELEITEEK